MALTILNSPIQYSLTYIYQAAGYIITSATNGIQSLNVQAASSEEVNDSVSLLICFYSSMTFQLQSAVTQQIYLLNNITSITAAQLPINGFQNVETDNLNLTIYRTSMADAPNNIKTSDCSYEMSDPCVIVNRTTGNCSDVVVISQVRQKL